MKWKKWFRRDQPAPSLPQNAASPEPSAKKSRPDNPIHGIEGDVLGRVKPAEAFCESVLQLDSSEGVVVGILGPWGSGKTSFVNMTREIFARHAIPIVDFNPWMFSGAEQLVESFFSEISAQLKMKPGMAEIGKSLEEYGELFATLKWLPFVGQWIERSHDAAKGAARLMQRKSEGIAGQRRAVEKALNQLREPIVVVVDDIDRLSSNEIRDVFRLVRLTGNFPNLIYVLAFDRKRVEAALSEDEFPGRAYFEKILQVHFDLPVVPDTVLMQQIFVALDQALHGIDLDVNFDKQLWPDIFMEIVKPLLRNMRDVRRYAASVGSTVRDLQGQIEIADLLALEAVRIFLPDVFSRLYDAITPLTATMDYGYSSDGQRAAAKQQIEALITAAGSDDDVVRALIERIFLAAKQHVGNMHYAGNFERIWLRKRRLSSGEILRLYLERIAGKSLTAFNIAEKAWALMSEQGSFSDFLSTLPVEQTADVIAGLETYEDEVNPERVVPGLVTLLNIAPSLPNTDHGMTSFGPGVVVGRVVYRLIRSQNSEAFVESATRQALPLLQSLHAKLQLIEMIGHVEGVGHKLVSEAVATELSREWRIEFRGLSPAALAAEPELLRSILTLRRDSGPGEPVFVLPPDEAITKALLLSARSDTRSQQMGSRAVKKSPRLAWKLLVEVFGSEDLLGERIRQLRNANPQGVGDIFELTDRYLSGWRPREFGD